jgi:hypothetical protein
MNVLISALTMSVISTDGKLDAWVDDEDPKRPIIVQSFSAGKDGAVEVGWLLDPQLFQEAQGKGYVSNADESGHVAKENEFRIVGEGRKIDCKRIEKLQIQAFNPRSPTQEHISDFFSD